MVDLCEHNGQWFVNPCLASTNIPCFCPVCQIVVVHLSLQRHMLPNSDSHILCGGHIGNWRLAWVGIWNPKRNGESVRGSSEGDRQCAHQVKEEGREACLVGCWVSETRTTSKRTSDTHYRHLFEGRARGTARAHWQHRGRSGLGRGTSVVDHSDPGGVLVDR
jgi:hypothetical protein